MKEVTLFYLEHCPYCIKARKAIDELKAAKPEYRDIDVKWIEESKETEIANTYDYYYVPSVYYGRKKLYEVNPSENYEDIKGNIDRAFGEVCGDR